MFVNIFSDYGWIYETTFKTIRSDIKSILFPKKVKIVPPLVERCDILILQINIKSYHLSAEKYDHLYHQQKYLGFVKMSE